MTTYPDYYTAESQYAREHPLAWHRHMGQFQPVETDITPNSASLIGNPADHCADILRQKLVCDADVGIITYNWIKNHHAPHPNFNVQHRCRDFDAVVRYALAHGIDGSSFPRGYFLRPADRPVVEFDEPPFDPEADG